MRRRQPQRHPQRRWGRPATDAVAAVQLPKMPDPDPPARPAALSGCGTPPRLGGGRERRVAGSVMWGRAWFGGASDRGKWGFKKQTIVPAVAPRDCYPGGGSCGGGGGRAVGAETDGPGPWRGAVAVRGCGAAAGSRLRQSRPLRQSRLLTPQSQPTPRSRRRARQRARKSVRAQRAPTQARAWMLVLRARARKHGRQRSHLQTCATRARRSL